MYSIIFDVFGLPRNKFRPQCNLLLTCYKRPSKYQWLKAAITLRCWILHPRCFCHMTRATREEKKPTSMMALFGWRLFWHFVHARRVNIFKHHHNNNNDDHHIYPGCQSRHTHKRTHALWNTLPFFGQNGTQFFKRQHKNQYDWGTYIWSFIRFL